MVINSIDDLLTNGIPACMDESSLAQQDPNPLTQTKRLLLTLALTLTLTPTLTLTQTLTL